MADYFSKLPESLIHHILSFLPFKEISRTCVLSKYFNTIWCNYPDLDFDLVNREEHTFLDGAENSLGECLVRRRFIRQLRLRIFGNNENNLAPRLDRWLRMSVEKGVSILVLQIGWPLLQIETSNPWYSVPQQVLVAPTLKVLDLTNCILDNEDSIELPSLEKLSLSDCYFVGDNLLRKIVCSSYKMKRISLYKCRGREAISVPEQLLVAQRLQVLKLWQCVLNEDSSFVGIDLPCLEELSLEKCYFVAGKNLLQKILCASPKMKHIYLHNCKGLGSGLSVSCPPLLKSFTLEFGDEFERIKIDAPSLETLNYYQSHYRACIVDLSSCTNLKELEIFESVVTVLEHLLSVLLSLKVLKLYDMDHSPKKYKISSQSLEKLIFFCPFLLENVKIDAPNLKSFSLENYDMSSEMKFSSWRIPKADDIHMKLTVKSFQKAWRAELQDFLVKLPNYENLKLFIFDIDTNFIMVKELRDVSFTSLQKFAEKSEFIDIFISSRDESNLVYDLSELYLNLTLGSAEFMICSSLQSVKSYFNKVGKWSILQEKYRLSMELVSPAEIQMPFDWESFVKSNSSHNGAIILRRPYKDGMDEDDMMLELMSSD